MSARLDGRHVGEGAHQDDDLRRVDLLVVHQPPQPPGEPARLRDLRPRARIVGQARQLGLLGLPALPVVDGQEKLHGGSAPRLVLDERRQRLESVEQAPADRVGRRDELGRGAEVPGQRQRLTVGLLALLEAAVLAAVDLDVRVPEPVDRLELVADQEEAGVRPAQLLDQPQLQAVRVLELVDHQVVELLAVALPQGVGVGEELDRLQLEVLEVERRAVLLELLVARSESGHQLPELLVGGPEDVGGDRGLGSPE